MKRRSVLFLVGLIGVTGVVWPQSLPSTPPTANCPSDSAKDTVQHLWDMAASGELLTSWGAAARLFNEPGPWPSDATVRVFSDYWWVDYYSCSDVSQPIVTVESHWGREPGSIDSQLRFTPPSPSSAEAAVGYRLILTTPQNYSWGPDGKPVMGKSLPGPKRWLIQGPPPPPFVTVTAAIRYVLEKRSQTKDPAIRKNADETLAKLLKMH